MVCNVFYRFFMSVNDWHNSDVVLHHFNHFQGHTSYVFAIKIVQRVDVPSRSASSRMAPAVELVLYSMKFTSVNEKNRFITVLHHFPKKYTSRKMKKFPIFIICITKICQLDGT